MYIIYAILAFSLLIIVHELGHFIMAKLNGVKVEEFSIGMGPKIISLTKNETKYSLGILPIGGYVKMLGEENGENVKGSLNSKSPIRRLSIILAGVTMNVLLSLVLFSVIANERGFTTPVIDTVIENGAVNGVLKPGDKFLEVDGRKVISDQDVRFGLVTSKSQNMNIKVLRGNEVKDFNIVPKLDEKSNVKKLGISFKYIEKPSIIESIKQGAIESVASIKQIYASLKMLFSGEANFKTDVGGPVSIMKMTGYAAKNGMLPLMLFTAMISINLAVINLLPFPALDGGWALMVLFELITGKKVPDKVSNAINTVGIVLLMGLMVIVTLKDILFPIKL